MRKIGRFGIAMASLLALSACNEAQSLRYGEPNFNTGVLLPRINLTSPGATPSTAYVLPAARDANSLNLQPMNVETDSLTTDCPDQPATGADFSADDVKRCVYALKRIIDDQYREYRITLHHLADGGNALLDVTNLGLTTAAAVTPGAAAKTVLAAIATGLLGTKTVLNEDLLYKQTIEIVLNQMDADRDRQFSVMLKEMSGTGYTIGQAKDDLLIYFAYGTFDHAVASLQATAAANKANCQAQRDNTKVATTSDTVGPAVAAAAAAPATGTGCPSPPAGG